MNREKDLQGSGKDNGGEVCMVRNFARGGVERGSRGMAINLDWESNVHTNIVPAKGTPLLFAWDGEGK